MAHDDTYDLAVLGSSDADLSQAAKFIQERLGKQIYNLWFPGLGVELRNACWSHLSVEGLLADLGTEPATEADAL